MGVHLRIPLALALAAALLSVHTASAKATAAAKLVNKPAMPDQRHENAICTFKRKIMVFGGRGVKNVRAYNDQTGKWEDFGKPPANVGNGGEFHHFQCVAWKDGVIIAGAFKGGFPNEMPMSDIWHFKPKGRKWVKLGKFPANRDRGSTGTFVRKKEVCFVAGTVRTHGRGAGTTKKWFDCFHLKTKKWRKLPNARKKRDHFGVVMTGARVYAVGGRHGGQPGFANPAFGVKEVEQYNFFAKKWRIILSLDTAHPGMIPANMGNQIFIGDGELGGRTDQATNKVEVIDAKTKKLILKNKLPKFAHRHGTGYAVCGGILFTATGAQRPASGGNIEFSNFQGILLNGKMKKCIPTKFW